MPKTKTPALAFPVRPIHEIAAEITATWPRVYFGAVPYLDAMRDLDAITDMYFMDSAREILQRFLGNATSWRGEDARRVKAEINALLRIR